jgi:hypothetical protein
MQFFDRRLPAGFWDRVIPEPNTGCWLWTAGTNLKGYGRFHVGYGRFHVGDGRMASAHRLAYEVLASPIPEAHQIDHLCKTPACCNPAHLEAVTSLENWRRGNAPSAVSVREGRCTKGHEYTPENTLLRVEHGQLKQRVCRTCRAADRVLEHAKRRRMRAERRAS